jgi:hypothetical protein
MYTRFVAGILQGPLIKQVCTFDAIANFRNRREIEIKETLIAVVLNNANCTVLTAQLTIAKLTLTKLHLNPSGAGGRGA